MMSKASAIALAQLNPHMGNVPANVERLVATRDAAAKDGALHIPMGHAIMSGSTSANAVRSVCHVP